MTMKNMKIEGLFIEELLVFADFKRNEFFEFNALITNDYALLRLDHLMYHYS